jgi:hypothetical protein
LENEVIAGPWEMTVGMKSQGKRWIRYGYDGCAGKRLEKLERATDICRDSDVRNERGTILPIAIARTARNGRFQGEREASME